MDLVYQIGHALYLNITNRCTNACSFCVRFQSNVLRGYDLRLEKEPTTEEVISAIGNPTGYREIVFCGYGEPLLRLPEVISISKYIYEHNVPVRINTNGQGNIIHQRNVVPEFAPFVSTVSISINAENEENYRRVCKPVFGRETYQKVKEFILECKKLIPRVMVTAVAVPGIDVQKVKVLAGQELKVAFKLRYYDDIIKDRFYGNTSSK